MFTVHPKISHATQGDYTCTVNDDGTTCTITKYTGAGGDLTIPATPDGYSVTYIGTGAFWGCSGLTSVTIPDAEVRQGHFFGGDNSSKYLVEATKKLPS